MSQVKNLSVVDVVAIACLWTGATAIVFSLNPIDAVVAIIGIASAYYSAKWVTLKKSPLSAGDIAGILLFWSAAAAISYLVQDAIIAIICIAAAYYLSKWIIRKEVEGPTE